MTEGKEALMATSAEDTYVEVVARQLWKLVECHLNENAADQVAFDEMDWRQLLIESERDEFRVLARKVLNSARHLGQGGTGTE